MLQRKRNVLVLYLSAILGVAVMVPAVFAQPTTGIDTTNREIILRSVDSLLTTIADLKTERAELQFEFRQLNNRIQSLERTFQGEFNNLQSSQGNVLEGLDTLRVMMPSEEPMRATNNNVIYLSQRQDSLVAYVGRLEQRIVTLPDNHYWGVRNGFKQFDHLLLFTFLAAITSLGVVLLMRSNDPLGNPSIDQVTQQEEVADRLSVSITLLVGSVLVILFILFIL